MHNYSSKRLHTHTHTHTPSLHPSHTHTHTTSNAHLEDAHFVMKLPLEMKDNGYSSKLKYEDNLSKVTNEMGQARGGAPFLQQSAGQVYSP